MFAINRYMFVGFIMYSTYLVGSFANDISGLSMLPVFALLIGLVFSPGCLRLNMSILYVIFFACIVYTLSYAVSSRGDYASYKYLMFFVKFLPFFLIPFTVIDRQQSFFKGILYVLLAFVAIALFHSVAYAVNPSVNARLEFGVFNPIWIARAVFEMVLISVIILKMKRSICIIFFLCAIVIAYSAGSKGPLVSFVLAFLFWYTSQNQNVIIRIRRLMLPLLAISAILFTIVHLSDVDSYLIQRFFMAVPEGSSYNIIEQSRMIVWPETLRILAAQDASKLLFGNGVGEFGSMYFGRPIDFRVYPHNLILEVVSELGLIVFLMTAIYIGKLLYFSKSKFKFIFIYFLCNSMFSGDLILNEYMFLYLGFLVVDRKLGKNFGEETMQVPTKYLRILPKPTSR